MNPTLISILSRLSRANMQEKPFAAVRHEIAKIAAENGITSEQINEAVDKIMMEEMPKRNGQVNENFTQTLNK